MSRSRKSNRRPPNPRLMVKCPCCGSGRSLDKWAEIEPVGLEAVFKTSYSLGARGGFRHEWDDLPDDLSGRALRLELREFLVALLRDATAKLAGIGSPHAARERPRLLDNVRSHASPVRASIIVERTLERDETSAGRGR